MIKKIGFTLCILYCLFIRLNAQQSFERIIRDANISLSDMLQDVCQTSDKGFALASRTFGAIVKTDSTGVVKWVTSFGGPGASIHPNEINECKDRGFIMTGYSTHNLIPGAQIFIVKTDSLGKFSWIREFGGPDYDEGLSVIQTSDLGFIATGGYKRANGADEDLIVIKVDKNGNEQWIKTIGGGGYEEGHYIIQTKDGGYLVAGHSGSFNTGRIPGVYVVKLDINGNKKWSKLIATQYSDYVNSIVEDPLSKSFLILSSVMIGQDNSILLWKMDSIGNVKWYKSFDTSEDENGVSLMRMSSNEYFIGGMDIPNPGIDKGVMIKTDSLGNIIWSKNIFSKSSLFLNSAKVTADSMIVMTGMFGVESTYRPAFIAKIDRNGNGICNSSDVIYSSVNIAYTNDTPLDTVKAKSGLSATTTLFNFSKNYIDSAMCVTITSAINIPVEKIDPFDYYPNPFSDKIILSLKEEEDFTVKIYDIMGEEKYSTLVHSKENVLDLSSMKKGVYILNLQSKFNVSTKKIIKH